MSNPFEFFGIKHLSASSLNKWIGCQGAWVSHYVFGVKGEVGPAAWRGTAVEAGLEAAITTHGGQVIPNVAAMDVFELEAGGEITDAIDKERANIEPMLAQAIDSWNRFGLPAPITQQAKTELWIDGLDVPIIGYADFVMDGYCIDLKTTLRLPSSPRFNHVLQAAGYAQARGESMGKLFYVTPKKAALYAIHQEDIDNAMADVRRRALGLQRSLKLAMQEAVSNQEAAKSILAEMCPPDLDSFYWKPEEFAAAQAQIPAWQ